MRQLAADIFKIFSFKFKKTFGFIVISEERELMFVFKALVNRGILGKSKKTSQCFLIWKIHPWAKFQLFKRLKYLECSLELSERKGIKSLYFMKVNHNITCDLVTTVQIMNTKSIIYFYILKYLDIQRGIPRKLFIIQIYTIWEINNFVKLREHKHVCFSFSLEDQDFTTKKGTHYLSLSSLTQCSVVYLELMSSRTELSGGGESR